VQLHWDENTLTIIVEDDGSSYSRVDVNPSSGGMGTTNMIKRANLIGATMVKEELSRGMKFTIGLKRASAENQSSATV
jgi:signal transduction histidine kinase